MISFRPLLTVIEGHTSCIYITIRTLACIQNPGIFPIDNKNTNHTIYLYAEGSLHSIEYNFFILEPYLFQLFSCSESVEYFGLQHGKIAELYCIACH